MSEVYYSNPTGIKHRITQTSTGGSENSNQSKYQLHDISSKTPQIPAQTLQYIEGFIHQVAGG